MQDRDDTAQTTRRDFLLTTTAGAALSALPGSLARAQTAPNSAPTSGPAKPPENDRVFICNEDSNTLSAINPLTNAIEPSINLTSFDEDHRPPFRLVTNGVVATHAGMIQKPLYHGAISIHGAVPSPDSTMIATTGRGSSNVYLIDTRTREVIGNTPNPNKRDDVVPTRLTNGILVGREPHEPTFTRNGRELWVTLRGSDQIAVLDVAKAIAESKGAGPGTAVRRIIPTMPGPAHVWFSRDGNTAFLVSQKVPMIEVYAVKYDANGFSTAERKRQIDISAQDKFGFSPFLKATPDGKEVWISHKLADRVAAIEPDGDNRYADIVDLGQLARPNHVEFLENRNGRVIYVSQARVDDAGPGGVASSSIAIIDRAAPKGQRKVVATFASGGREAHGLWIDPTNSRLYVAHEQDELPNTPHAGQTVCSAFDVADPFKPQLIARIPLGEHKLPSGALRNKKSINLVYVRPGSKSASA